MDDQNPPDRPQPDETEGSKQNDSDQTQATGGPVIIPAAAAFVGALVGAVVGSNLG